jgi:hypothetical protein
MKPSHNLIITIYDHRYAYPLIIYYLMNFMKIDLYFL